VCLRKRGGHALLGRCRQCGLSGLPAGSGGLRRAERCENCVHTCCIVSHARRSASSTSTWSHPSSSASYSPCAASQWSCPCSDDSVTSVARQLANAFLQLLPPLLVVCAPARATLFVVAAGPRCRMRERPPRLRDKLASEGGGEARLARQQPSPQRLASALVRVYLDLGLAWSPCGYGSV
jgi:hypothetical protein